MAIAALAAALIKPTGFGFEIMYLDRSAGEEANVTSFVQTTEQNGLWQPTIRLLYRPYVSAPLHSWMILLIGKGAIMISSTRLRTFLCRFSRCQSRRLCM